MLSISLIPLKTYGKVLKLTVSVPMPMYTSKFVERKYHGSSQTTFLNDHDMLGVRHVSEFILIEPDVLLC